MNKLTAEQISAEMDKFESLNPLPKYTSRCGNGYAVSEFNAWDGHAYCHKWEGWIARAAVALPILEQRERDEGEWKEWRGGKLQFDLLSKAVTVKFADGFTHTGTAGHYYWGDNCSNPIIAYRIIPERDTNQSGDS